MSIRAVMALTLVGVGLLLLCIVFIDWTPDVTPEEMFGTRAQPQLPPDAMRPAMDGRPDPRQVPLRNIADIQADVNQADELAAADTPQAATQLVSLLHAYAPGPSDRFQAARQPDLQQARQQARNAIMDLIADSENPHLVDALAKSLDNRDDRGYVMIVCQTLARRQDTGSLPLVWWRLKQLRGNTEEYRAIVSAMASYPHEQILELLKPVVKNPQDLDRYAAYDVLAALGTRDAAELLIAVSELPRKSEHAHARRNAVTLLRHIGTEAIIEPMLDTLKNEKDEQTYETAGSAVFRFDAPRLAWPLFDWVTKHSHHNPGLPGKRPSPGPYSWFYKIPDVVVPE